MSGSWYRHRPTPAVPLHGPQPGDASEDRVARPVITVDAGPQFTVLAVADSNADSNELNRARTTPNDDGRPPEVRGTDGDGRADDSRRRSGGFCLRLASSRTERWAHRGHMTAERMPRTSGKRWVLVSAGQGPNSEIRAGHATARISSTPSSRHTWPDLRSNTSGEARNHDHAASVPARVAVPSIATAATAASIDRGSDLAGRQRVGADPDGEAGVGVAE